MAKQNEGKLKEGKGKGGEPNEIRHLDKVSGAILWLGGMLNIKPGMKGEYKGHIFTYEERDGGGGICPSDPNVASFFRKELLGKVELLPVTKDMFVFVEVSSVPGNLRIFHPEHQNAGAVAAAMGLRKGEPLKIITDRGIGQDLAGVAAGVSDQELSSAVSELELSGAAAGQEGDSE